jgi:hypothetical protein
MQPDAEPGAGEVGDSTCQAVADAHGASVGGMPVHLFIISSFALPASALRWISKNNKFPSW